MSNAIDLSHIYSLRNNFTIIGLTGQIGSGCSEVAEQLSKGFNYGDFEDPREVGIDPKTLELKHNSYRKYRIVYKYAQDNFKSYSRINYKDVLVIFLLQKPFEDFIQFLRSHELLTELEPLVPEGNFNDEVQMLMKLKHDFDILSEEYKSIKSQDTGDSYNWDKLYQFYFHSGFLEFCNSLHSALKSKSRIKRNKLLQIISTNLRKSGHPFEFSEPTADNIFTIVELMNRVINSYRETSVKRGEERTQIVIDDLRNPIEIMYFKQRYAAFYTIAVNRDDKSRTQALDEKYNSPDIHKIPLLCQEEYKGGKNHEFYKANISACIQQADIHISFLTKTEVDIRNADIQEKNLANKKIENAAFDSTSPYFTWRMQLLKYVSLISQPGLVTPSPEERCMQMAYTAKHNSGCISRHVGAAITDENYSLKAIGWNNTPTGQVPCVLRNTEDLLNRSNDIASFTNYEKTDSEFSIALQENFRSSIKENGKNLKGRNVCFCFKDLKNSFSDGKNQVHTRSLHAEESAFLQITKYGGVGIENGKLFTTASPCELCSKKAYQLGIKVIYYIDPYPSISENHILSAGSKPIESRLFSGAIGNAYHWLYDPIMPYKDEMTLLLGNKFNDFATKQEKKANDFKKDADNSKAELLLKGKEIAELKQRILELEEGKK